MPSSPLASIVSALVRTIDRARAPLHGALGTHRADSAGRAARAERRDQARADRAQRLFVARFGALPEGRVITALQPGGRGA